jgi:hypothetical protein
MSSNARVRVPSICVSLSGSSRNAPSNGIALLSCHATPKSNSSVNAAATSSPFLVCSVEMRCHWGFVTHTHTRKPTADVESAFDRQIAQEFRQQCQHRGFAIDLVVDRVLYDQLDDDADLLSVEMFALNRGTTFEIRARCLSHCLQRLTCAINTLIHSLVAMPDNPPPINRSTSALNVCNRDCCACAT